MKFLLRSLIVLAVLSSITACETQHSSSKSGAYFGGQIINPKVDYLLILKGDKIIDTTYLDKNNSFSYTFEKEQSGIFYFKHATERQIIFLEPNDSIMLRLNTFEFDESLTFSGKGARENNFLMHMFLLNEDNSTWLLNHSNKTPKSFLKYANTMRAEQEKKLNKLLKKELFSSRFRKMASKSIDYEFYDLKERYYSLINSLHPEYVNELPKTFFNYQDSISFSDPSLQYYYGYLRFLDNYIKNRYYQNCKEKDDTSINCLDFRSPQSYLTRIALADSIITTQELKERYVERLATSGIIVSNTIAFVDSIATRAFEVSLSKKAKAIITNAAKTQRTYLSKSRLLNRIVTSAATKQQSQISSIITRPTIIYTWSNTNIQEYNNTYREIKRLRKRFPGVNFIGINIDDISTETWLKEFDGSTFNTAYEYKLETFRESQTLLRKMTKRLLFITESGEVIHRSLNLGKPIFTIEIKEHLLSNNLY